MLAEALGWIAKTVRAGEEIQIVEQKDDLFSNRELHRVPEKPVAKPAPTGHSTLRSLVTYLTTDPDTMVEGCFVSVGGPSTVLVESPTQGKVETRKKYADAQAIVPRHQFGEWLSLVEMNIYLRTGFVQTEARDALVTLLSGVVDGAEVEATDDGMAQKTTMRQGISMVKEGELPPSVDLAPYRSFHDVEQVESSFIVRLQKGRSGVEVALFEADGGAWKHEATQRIADYLSTHLGDDFKVFA